MGKSFLFVTNRYLPCMSGAEKLSSQIAERLVSMGHAVRVLTLDALSDSDYASGKRRQAQREEINGVEVRRFGITRFPYHERISRLMESSHRLDWLFSGGSVFSLKMMQAVRDETDSFDAVVAGVMPFTGVIYPAMRAAHERRKKFILLPLMHFGQIQENDPMSDFKTRTLRPAKFRYEYFSEHAMEIYGRSEMIITQGIYEENFIKSMTDSRFARVNPFVRVPKDVSRGGGFRIITVGNHNFEKGIETTLRAFSLLRKSAPDAVLTIIGRIDRKFELMAKRDGIRHLESATEEEKESALLDSDVFLLPSAAESLGIASLEAHAFGMPTIAAYCSGSMQIVKDGRNGYLVPFGDFLLTYKILMTLYKDRLLLDRLKKRSREIAEKGDPDIDGYRGGPFSMKRQEEQIKRMLEMI